MSDPITAEALPPLTIVMRCSPGVLPRARYVLDSLMLAAGVPLVHASQPPPTGPWLLYADDKQDFAGLERCVAVAHVPQAWRLFDGERDVEGAGCVDGLAAVLPGTRSGFDAPCDIRFDLMANAFYFLSSWAERSGQDKARTRRLHADSVHARWAVPQDIVDRYLQRLMDALHLLCARLGMARWPAVTWPGGAAYALVLSHDVDFIPAGWGDIALQGAKTVARHLIRQRDPADAARAAAGLMASALRGRDPYGCVPEIIARERAMGVRSSFQVAVGHRHPQDVNYRIEDDRVRDYLGVIGRSGFDLCLHGSYRSTENPDWYREEVALLTRRLGRPSGSRQHFLSFDYDTLFTVQEQSGIEYDMSMGFPDRIGPRAGFSSPYFPFCLEKNRPYDVVQISLSLMDVSLRSYMGLKGAAAWRAVLEQLDDLKRKRGCVSAVWHPIVFGGARDPGDDALYWKMAEHVGASGGLATDGRTINDYWRKRARGYASLVGPH